jgi:AcrR family transcriptional regulator
MRKTDARRQHLAEILADHVLAHGLAQASLRPLAKSAGTSDRMLLYYFQDKDDLISQVLTVIAARLTAGLAAVAPVAPMPADDLADLLGHALGQPAMTPYMALWLEIVALAARGDSFYQSIGRQIAEGFVTWLGTHLAAPDNTRHAAMGVLARIEGALVLASVGLAV